jgi:hypothetical protein
MKILSAAEVDANLDDLALIDRLDQLFRTGCRCRLGIITPSPARPARARPMPRCS